MNERKDGARFAVKTDGGTDEAYIDLAAYFYTCRSLLFFGPGGSAGEW